jgi:NAD(P)-dependent dehydrogenase (short-subunit alcohol dehydrogenase family)
VTSSTDAAGRSRTALVTGATRGLGRATAARLVGLGYDVLISGRTPDALLATAAELGCGGVELDVADPASVARLVDNLEAEGVELDVLVNNAGIYVTDGPLRIDEDDLAQEMATNLYGPWLLMRAFVPWMVDRGYGRVVNVSSESGSFVDGPSLGTYGVSKAALNALTVSVAAEIPSGVDVLVNAVCPGWVATDMGGPNAPRTIEEGVEGIITAATLPAGGHHGQFLRDGAPIPW